MINAQPTASLKLLVIDNYDSFTFNLVQYLGELGALVTVVRNDAIDVADIQRDAVDAIVISPGPCTPTQAGISVAVVQQLSGIIPILGVCLGHQSIAAAFGGKIVRTGIIMHGKTSPVDHRNTDVFAGLPQPFEATRYHSLMADADSLPDCFEVSAWTDEMGAAQGQRTIQGIAHKLHPTWGVQFHPESILTTSGKALLANFLELAAAFCEGRPLRKDSQLS